LFTSAKDITKAEKEAAGMMKYRTRLLALAMLAQVVMPAMPAAAPDAARQTELLYLLKHDCGSCHGMTRQGGLGPGLLPGNVQGRPVALLVNTILDGRPGTPMPPWRGQLTEQEAHWLVEVLRTGEGL
jgi:cytochrome c55X